MRSTLVKSSALKVSASSAEELGPYCHTVSGRTSPHFWKFLPSTRRHVITHSSGIFKALPFKKPSAQNPIGHCPSPNQPSGVPKPRWSQRLPSPGRCLGLPAGRCTAPGSGPARDPAGPRGLRISSPRPLRVLFCGLSHHKAQPLMQTRFPPAGALKKTLGGQPAASPPPCRALPRM